MNDRFALIAMVAGAIKYGHIGTIPEIVADAKEIVDEAEKAAANPATPTTATDILGSIGAGHLAKQPNATAEQLLAQLDAANQKIAELEAAQTSAAAPAATA